MRAQPNPPVAPLHPKAMPVILHESDYARWLEGSEAEAHALAVPYPSQLMGVGWGRILGDAGLSDQITPHSKP